MEGTPMIRLRETLLLFGAVILMSACLSQAQTVQGGPAAPNSKPGSISGTVRSSNGPEAGVWVIAETTDLPTKLAKVVVTDDTGRYVIPEMPKASYKIWVRGYGLVDSEKVDGAPGSRIDLIAKVAPSAQAAAKYFPGMYWYSMLHIPPSNLFPGTGAAPGGNGIPAILKTQGDWIDTIKNSCQSCHALGSENIRNPKVKELAETVGLKDFSSSSDMWMRRLSSGQAQTLMNLGISQLGPDLGLKNFADWTDRIAKGELPDSKPSRPKGIERNLVATIWDWGAPNTYLHDAISTDKRNPTVNANGLIYGSPEDSTDNVPVLDPVNNKAWTISHPYEPGTPSAYNDPKGPSVFWGDDPVWDGHTLIHNLIMDQNGKVWFSARFRRPENPSFCKDGPDALPAAKVAPVASSPRQMSVFDPKTNKWTLINTCFGAHHLYFGHDADNTLWTSYGHPSGPVIGWLNWRVFEETGDAKKAQGWAPQIVDVPGWGKRGEYVDEKAPIDANKQKRVMAAFYGVQPSPVDDTVWGQSIDVGFSRLSLPGYLIHFIPGPDPTNTGLTELFRPPTGTFGPRGIDLDSKGIVWTALSSGQLASFDRSKCKERLIGPSAVTGEQCYEGWTLYPFEGPKMAGTDVPAEHAYYVWVDRYNTFGLGKDIPLASTNGGEAVTALVDGKLISFHVPYPAGFFTKNVDGRIDDPNAGWKGRALWTTSGTRAMFHNETGKGESPRVYKLQIRPDPLAD
jgi:hypothetical protein